MHVVLPLLLVLQSVQVRVGTDKANQDSVRRQALRDSIRREVAMRDDDDNRRAPRRIPVTAEHLRTAFRDPSARTLLERARSARMTQDSTLIAYDASAYQRVSVGLEGSLVAAAGSARGRKGAPRRLPGGGQRR
jgi:hypothetical protein